jgi:hypothetical protein
MKPRSFYPAFALALCYALSPHAQTTQRKPFQPADKQAPGAAPDKVWLNAPTKIYHCPDDRYYGRTKQGVYTTEAEAIHSGAHVARGSKSEHCFK